MEIPKGYKPTQYQEFDTFEEGDKLFREYCTQCTKIKNCGILGTLLVAMGNNYSYWDGALIKVEPEDFNLGIEKKVMCKEHEPLQTKLKLEETITA